MIQLILFHVFLADYDLLVLCLVFLYGLIRERSSSYNVHAMKINVSGIINYNVMQESQID